MAVNRWAAACAVLLLMCAADGLTGEPVAGTQIVVVRATFRSHLAIVQNCESRGLASSVAFAKATGANLALVFAPLLYTAPGRTNPQYPDNVATWVPFEGNPADIAGVRAFMCRDAFIEKVTAGIKAQREVQE